MATTRPLVDRLADQQADERGGAGIGQGDRREAAGASARIGGEECFQRQPGIGLRAAVDRLAGRRSVAEGQRAGRRSRSPPCSPSTRSDDAGEAVVGRGDPALHERGAEAVGPFQLDRVMVGHVAAGLDRGRRGRGGPSRWPGPAARPRSSGRRPRRAPPARPSSRPTARGGPASRRGRSSGRCC